MSDVQIFAEKLAKLFEEHAENCRTKEWRDGYVYRGPETERSRDFESVVQMIRLAAELETPS